MAEPTDLPVDPHLTVLAGENDGGKTASLHAIEALLGGRSLDAEDLCQSTGGPVEIEGAFTEHDGTDPEPTIVRIIMKDGGVSHREVQRWAHQVFGVEVSSLPLPELKQLMETASINSPGGQRKQPYIDAVVRWLETRPGSEFHDAWVPLDGDTAERLPALTSYNSATAIDPESHIRTLVVTEVRRRLAQESFGSRLDDVKSDLSALVDPN